VQHIAARRYYALRISTTGWRNLVLLKSLVAARDDGSDVERNCICVSLVWRGRMTIQHSSAGVQCAFLFAIRPRAAACQEQWRPPL